MDYSVRPISDRTHFTGARQESDFTVTWSTAERLLLAELAAIRARNVVMELDLAESQIRLDGRPRADARPTSNAVRVVFEVDGETMAFATARFLPRTYRRAGMQVGWQHNVYAIAKGLEALRMVKRYGIVENDQQYTGFKALPSGTAMGASTDPPMPRAAAAHVIAVMAYEDPAAVLEAEQLVAATALGPLEADQRARVFQRAKRNAHPDRHGGDHTRWSTLAPALAVFGAA